MLWVEKLPITGRRLLFATNFYDPSVRLHLVFLLFRWMSTSCSLCTCWHGSDANIPSRSPSDFLQCWIYDCGNARVFNIVVQVCISAFLLMQLHPPFLLMFSTPKYRNARWLLKGMRTRWKPSHMFPRPKCLTDNIQQLYHWVCTLHVQCPNHLFEYILDGSSLCFSNMETAYPKHGQNSLLFGPVSITI